MILMVEMAVFGLLVIPLPFAVKRKLFTYVPPAFPVPASIFQNQWQTAHGCGMGIAN